MSMPTYRLTFSLGSSEEGDKRREALEKLAKEEGMTEGAYLRMLIDKERKKRGQ